ncbi:hypothetical protein OKW43_000066 [Paraburkholderia sp. WC7.3g]
MNHYWKVEQQDKLILDLQMRIVLATAFEC